MNNLYELIRSAPTTPEFIANLNKLIPHCHPKVSQSEREIWMAVGRRDLVSELVAILDQLDKEEK